MCVVLLSLKIQNYSHEQSKLECLQLGMAEVFRMLKNTLSMEPPPSQCWVLNAGIDSRKTLKTCFIFSGDRQSVYGILEWYTTVIEWSWNLVYSVQYMRYAVCSELCQDVSGLPTAPAINKRYISGTDLIRHFDVLPHWDTNHLFAILLSNSALMPSKQVLALTPKCYI